MGVLAQAKYGDQQFWRVKFHVTNGEGSACTQSAIYLFIIIFLSLLSFGWGARGFFSFVPNMFPSSSQWVPIRFSMCSPRVFPIAPHFNPIFFAQSPPLLSIESSILGSLHRFNFFLVMGQSNWLIAKKKHLKKNWTCEAPPTN